MNRPLYEFASSASYWKPGLEEEDTYSQMYSWKCTEIPCNLVTLSNQLGEVQLREPCAKWGIPPHDPVDETVKLVKNGAPWEERLGTARTRTCGLTVAVVSLKESVSGFRSRNAI